MPHLAGATFGSARFNGDVLSADWRLDDGSMLFLLSNLSAQTSARPHFYPSRRPIWGGAPPDTLPPWSVYWGIGA
jgi:hypothetical protein